MRASLVAAAVCLSIAGLSRAGEVTASMRQPVNIPAQPLSLALQTLAKECDRQVLYRSEIVGAYRTDELSGDLTFDEALQKLLSGTSLTYRYLDEKTVTIDPQDRPVPQASVGSGGTWPVAALSASAQQDGALRVGWLDRLRLAMAPQADAQSSSAGQPAQPDDVETVVVTATGSQVELPGDYAGGQVARGGRVGLFGNLDMMDVPFSSTNFTAEFMRNLQARSVADVVQSDPGVRVARGFGNFQELYVVRGFPVYSDDMSYNGLYGLLPRQYVAAEFLERVEVFRGANSFLNGAAPSGSGIGGNFNLVPKRAPDSPLNRLTLGTETGGEWLGAMDVARRFGSDGQFGMRVNGVRRAGDTAVDDEHRKLSVVSIGMDYRGEQARFSADFGFQNHHIDAPRPSVTPSFLATEVPDAPDADANYAQKWTFTEERDKFGVIRGEYDFSEHAKVWAATGLRDGTEHNILSNPTADAAGNTSSYRFDNFREDRITTSEIGVRGEFKTGSVGHRVSVSGSIFKLDSKNAYAFSSFAGFPGSLYAPVQVTPPAPDFFTGGELFDPLTTTLTKTSSVAVADMLSLLNERLLVIVGARNQKIEQNSYNYDTGAKESSYDKSRVTPVFAAVVKPTSHVSLYGNYAEGLLQGDVAPLTFFNPDTGLFEPVRNGGAIFKPFVSEQVEIGAKYDSGSFGGTVSAFRVNKPVGLVDPDTATFGPDGEQTHKGIEISVYGVATEGLRLLGGVTFLDTKAQNGHPVIGVPDAQANFGVDWDVPGLTGFTLDGRVSYTTKQTANLDDTLKIPSWTRLDIGARYALPIRDKDFTLRLRVDNVTDKKYWASVGGSYDANYMVQGAPRTFSLSASVDL